MTLTFKSCYCVYPRQPHLKKNTSMLLCPLLCCKPKFSQYLTNLVGSSASLVTGCLPYQSCLYVSAFILFLMVNKTTSMSLIILPFLFDKKEERNGPCLLVLVERLAIEYLQPSSFQKPWSPVLRHFKGELVVFGGPNEAFRIYIQPCQLLLCEKTKETLFRIIAFLPIIADEFCL